MKEIKTIWVLLRSNLVTLPPVMTVIEYLLNSGEYNVKFISTNETGIEHERFEELILPQIHKANKLKKLYNYYTYRKFVKYNLSKIQKEDIVWIASLDTAQACKGLSLFHANKYILQLHELYDNHPKKLGSIKSIAQNAYKVVVPELNRARILQVWFQLKKRPIVLPNKPWFHPRKKYMTPTHETTKEIIKHYDSSKKVIIYQGHIEKGRSLEPIIQVINELDNVEFWLLGVDHSYVNELLKMSDKVKYWGYVPAPYHLEITSYADVGVMSYDLINLNHMYCAPNKVWEYLGFNLFFICNDVGSLDNLVSQNCCVCLDFNDRNKIKEELLLNINKEKSFKKIYDSMDIGGIIENILGDF